MLSRRLGLALLWIVPFVALIPAARWGWDAWSFARLAPEAAMQPASLSYDYVVWAEADGQAVAQYVFPRGPGADADIQPGDVLAQFDGSNYFTALDYVRAVEATPPGATRTYVLLRGGETVRATVRFARYPVFLYPLSAALWYTALWGFAFGLAVQGLALLLVAPLARRSREATATLALLVLSAVWVGGTLARMLALTVLGPPMPSSTYDALFQTLTLISVAGWIAFPCLLLLAAARPFAELRHSVALAVPAAAFLVASLLTIAFGALGPLTFDRLVPPILFYACCYIGTAGLLDAGAEQRARWHRVGQGIVAVAAAAMALSVLGVLPLFGIVTEAGAGWLVVGIQLLVLAPVILVSLRTLAQGSVERVLGRGVAFVVAMTLLFLAYTGGSSLLMPLVGRAEAPQTLVMGVYVVAVVAVGWFLARRLRAFVQGAMTPGRQTALAHLARFEEALPTLVTPEALVERAIAAVGEAFRARSAVLFVAPEQEGGRWHSATYHPEPPYLRIDTAALMWPILRDSGGVWSRNAELRTCPMPEALQVRLEALGAALAVPLRSDQRPVGLLVLGHRLPEGSVYNLDDVASLRSIAVQIGLAASRLELIRRQEDLARRTSEAELVALRSQINPHFLFNALNTVVALIATRPQEAESVVENLADLFRTTLNVGSATFVSLRQEIGLVRNYLAIEMARFGHKLCIVWEIEPEAEMHLVPALCLQTLVENAVKHGIERVPGGGTLSLRAHLVDAPEGGSAPWLRVYVHDEGAGIPPLFGRGLIETAGQSFLGTGLTNVSERLQLLYGRSDLLQHQSAPDAGTSAILCLPPPVTSGEAAAPARPHAELPSLPLF